MAHRKYDNPTRGRVGFSISRSASGRKAKSLLVSRKLTAANPIKRQPITITHREDAFGSGAFWDHYTTRSTTGRTTEVSHDPAVRPTLEAPGARKQGKYKGDLPGGLPQSSRGTGKGLLMITGGNYGLDSEKPRNAEHVPKEGGARARHGQRVAHEAGLLRQAQLTGRPVLGICGGSWRVLESYGGSTVGVKPKTHQTKKMPYLTTKGVVAKVASQHGLSMARRSMLSSVFKDDAGQTPDRVNSAHWAVAEESSPGLLKGTPTIGTKKQPLLLVSARGSTPGGAPYINSGDKHAHSVEAFETRHGAPAMGIQWHPEAYGGDFPQSHIQANKRLLNWMAQAGDAYEARRDMTAQFKAAMDPRRSLPPRMHENRALAVARTNAQIGLQHGEEGAIEARQDLAAEFSRRVGAQRLTPRYLAGNKALQLVRRNAQL